MEDIWDAVQIKKILPQRYPFLFIDRVLEIDRKEARVVCLKNVTVNEYFFSGHFPNRPVMPGTIIVEAMAQASIVLFSVLKPDIADKNPDYYLGKVEAKFIKPVKVGDQLVLVVSRRKIVDNAGLVDAVATVDGQIVAKAEITFGIKLNNG